MTQEERRKQFIATIEELREEALSLYSVSNPTVLDEVLKAPIKTAELATKLNRIMMMAESAIMRFTLLY